MSTRVQEGVRVGMITITDNRSGVVWCGDRAFVSVVSRHIDEEEERKVVTGAGWL